jgi:hypothetical protein
MIFDFRSLGSSHKIEGSTSHRRPPYFLLLLLESSWNYTQMSATIPAVTYDVAEPLLLQSSSSSSTTVGRRVNNKKAVGSTLFNADQHRRFKMSSLCLGLLVGFFIQASTLGANYLVVTVSGEDVMTTSKKDIVLFSLLWSLFTSFLAIVILAFLRNLVRATYETDNEEQNYQLDDVILDMECRFVVGALIGVCTAWALTDLILGLSVQIVYSFLTLGVALAWCKLMMWCFAYPEDDDEQNEQEETDIISIA